MNSLSARYKSNACLKLSGNSVGYSVLPILFSFHPELLLFNQDSLMQSTSEKHFKLKFVVVYTNYFIVGNGYV